MDTTNLIAYLPFDTSTTADLCGNSWTATGSPTISDNVLNFNANGQYLSLDGGITLGGKDFTIRGKFNLSSASGSYCVIFNFSKATQTNQNLFCLRRNGASAQLQFICMNATSSNINVTLNTEHDFEVAYTQSDTTFRLFIDGQRVFYWAREIPETNFSNVWLGRANYSADGWLRGTIDEFMIFDGVALHTENFTPPTDADYADLKFALGEETVPVTYTFDVERHVKNAPLTWRYENAGFAELLTTRGTTLKVDTTKSVTGFAFYVDPHNSDCFNTPAGIKEIWFKFDLYIDSAAAKGNRFSFGHYSSSLGGYVGIWNGGGNFSAWDSPDKFLIDAKPTTAIDTNVKGTRGAINKIFLHMVSDATNGRIELTVNDSTYTYTGNVNNGADFDTLYFYSSGANMLFSNVIVSNAEIGADENASTDFFELTYTFDVERRVTNTPNINEDTPPQLSFSGSDNNYATLPDDVLPSATEFTIEAKFSTTSTKSSSNNYQWGTIAGRELSGGWQNDFGLCVNDGKLCFWAEPSRNGSNSTRNTTSDAIVNDGQIHTAAVRSNADGSIDLFCDGEIVAHTDNVNAKTPDTQNILVASNSNVYSALQMNLYEVRFWNTAREEIFADVDGTEEDLQGWYIPTENGLTDYSPNIRNATVTGTVSYSEVNTVFVDVDYESTNDALGWRYEDCAVYFGTGAPINFHVPPTAEIWVRFDVYFDGVSRWYAYDNGIYGMTGITAQTSLELDFLSAGSAVKTLPDICKAKVTQTYLLHMISGVADGLIEVWCGLEKIGTYTGNVNNGRLFADFKLRSDDIGTSFTELIISNSELQPDEKPANTVRATKTSQLNTCNTKTEKIWLDRGGDYPFPYLDLTTREVLRQLITETIEGEGEFSPITTIWLKFDVYFDGINRWSAYNISETNGKNGVFSDLPLDFSFLANDFEVVRGQSALIANRWQTVIVHMESAEAPNGMIDVWIDGVQMHQYLGNVNNGEEFTHIYLTSEGGGTMFKNFIASSAPLTEDDNPQTVATGMGQLAFTVWHNGEALLIPLKLSSVPINPALTVRWQGCDWYNPLVLPSAENASEVAVRYNGAIYALSYF